ncbi:MAG: gamma-glutamyltransferase [Planctomycetota bacterium]
MRLRSAGRRPLAGDVFGRLTGPAGSLGCLLLGLGALGIDALGIGASESADPTADRGVRLRIRVEPTPNSAAAANDLVARGPNGCVVAAEPQAARIGLDALERGGNAVDAAVATALALAVTHPQAGNLGGGGFMVIRMADGRTAALDFRETAPGAATRDMYLQADGSVHPEASLWGALAGGVPGSPAGLCQALDLFGSRPLAELAAPAITLARFGFEVDHFLARALDAKARTLGRFESSRAVFFDGDEPLQAGQILRQSDLADTLERFAEGGVDGFYGGETARRFAAAMKDAGGIITEADLAGYESVRREVLRGDYRGFEVLAMPPVSSGGVALLQMLELLEPYDLPSMGYGSAQSIHLLSEVMRRAFADRTKWLGDTAFADVPMEGLLDPDYLQERGASIALDAISEVAIGVPPGAPEGQDTTHFSIVDAEGNAVSCTTTINSSFGSAMVVDRLGFLLNNEMDDFSAKPGVPNQYGLIGYEANAIAPGKRMLSSMTPIIVCEDGELRSVIGSPGGSRIITTVLQVLINSVDHAMSMPEAVTAPRVHHQWKPQALKWELRALNPDSRRLLQDIGHRFEPRASTIGRCQAIQVLDSGLRVGAADRRSGLSVLQHRRVQSQRPQRRGHEPCHPSANR